MLDVSVEIKQKQDALQQNIEQMKKHLEEETRKVAELSNVETNLKEAEGLLDEAIARLASMPLWIRERFTEVAKQKLKNSLKAEQQIVLMPEEQVFFDCLTTWLSEVINNYQRGIIYPFSVAGDLSYNAKTKSWHIPIKVSDTGICSWGIVLLQSHSKVEDNINLSVFGELNGWMWGVDASSEWRKAMVADDEFLVKMLENIPAIYLTMRQDILAAIDQKQIITASELLKKCKENESILKCLLLDLQKTEKIVFLGSDNLITTNLNKMQSVCYKNVVGKGDIPSPGPNGNLELDLHLEESDIFFVSVIPDKGIQWGDKEHPLIIPHEDIVNGLVDPSQYQRKFLGAIADKMGLHSKAKAKDTLWERIRDKYIEITTEAS